MRYERPKDLEAYRLEFREFVLSDLEKLADKIERSRRFDWDLTQKILREKGALSLTAPVEWGGMGLNFTEYLPILEEISKTHGSIRALMHQENRSWQIIERYGTEEQKKRWLPRLAVGEATRCVAMTEPEAGSGGGHKDHSSAG